VSIGNFRIYTDYLRENIDKYYRFNLNVDFRYNTYNKIVGAGFDGCPSTRFPSLDGRGLRGG
jgi:hypothetical protein